MTFQSLILHTETVESMTKSLKSTDDKTNKTFVIAKLTRKVKMILVFLVFLPRIGITTYLLWLGCRWLLATNSFSNLIQNAVCLEFIICLKDTVYFVLVPHRNKVDLQNTKIPPRRRREKGSIMAFTRTLAWGLLAALWVWLYMGIPHVCDGLQAVLPGYKWDLHNTCEPWVSWRYCVDPPCPASLVFDS